MQEYKKDLGKVVMTPAGKWDITKSYDLLCLVYEDITERSYISKQYVPTGVDLQDSRYWMPLNVSGYSDSNIIILNQKDENGNVKSYSLEEAINKIAEVGRKPGAIIGFYHKDENRLDIGGRWEIWQFDDNNIYNWNDLSHWTNIYYNHNKFVGWFRDENVLNVEYPKPEIGSYAYVGNSLDQAIIYICNIKYIWTETTFKVWDYVSVYVKGNVTVGSNGNWFNEGVDTCIPAVGPAGKTPIIKVRDGENIDISFDGEHWEVLLPLTLITPEIRITDTKTLDAGSKAVVKNIGTLYKPIFEFSIPMGVQGAKGEKGDGWSIKGFIDREDQLPSFSAIGDSYLVGTSEPYEVYVYKDDVSKFVNIGTALEVKASIFDGGRADTQYGGARTINCGGADAYLTY